VIAEKSDPLRLVPDALGDQLRMALRTCAAKRLRVDGPQHGLAPAAVQAAIDAVHLKLAYVADPTLRERLGAASAAIGAGLSNPEIRAFVDTRNALAHRMTFDAKKGTPYNQYAGVRHVVDRLLLGLLRYRGPFIDCRRHERAIFGSDVHA
jgi:hypothetical protein